MTAYYNEIDPFKAATLREAIQAGAIAPGDVDQRSISDVRASELVGYTQCHFFAGGGFWSVALRWAGWPDDRAVWTGSCPCPSFSAAGKGKGFEDPRHLWPEWFDLIRLGRPAVVFGEQVAAAIGHGWLDLVQANLEDEAYTVGPVVLGAHSFGGYHIRQRLFFVAVAESSRGGTGLRDCDQAPLGRLESANLSGNGLVADSASGRGHDRRGLRIGCDSESSGTSETERRILWVAPEERCATGRVAIPECLRPQCQPVVRPAGVFAAVDGTPGTWGTTGAHGTGAGRVADPERDGGRADLPQRRAQGRTADGRGGALGLLAEPQGGRLGMRGSAPGRTGHPALTDGAGELGQPCGAGLEGHGGDGDHGDQSGRIGAGSAGPATATGEPVRLALPHGVLPQLSARQGPESGDADCAGPHGEPAGRSEPCSMAGTGRTSATDSHWRDADWLRCRDGKWRPVEPGTFPLATGYPARVGLLRLAGDAICVETARQFIAAYLETEGE